MRLSILTENDNYWRNIFDKRDTDRDAQDRIMKYIKSFVSTADRELLDLPLTQDEIRQAILQAKRMKSPGIDGLPIEFYSILLNNGCDFIVDWLLKIFNQAQRKGELPYSMRQIQVRLLYKKESEEDKKLPKNYRPISLLSVDYKILSRILANRMKSVLPKLIDSSQACCPGRHIGDQIHLVQSILHYARTDNKKIGIILLDFEKAFDSVDHGFLFRMLKELGFPPNFIKLTHLAFTKTHASLIINGKRTKGFDLPGGGRQGDNLFPLLFALVVHGLTLAVKNTKLTGISPHEKLFSLLDEPLRIIQYADDTALFFNNPNDVFQYQEAVELFCRASGMRINWDKTLGIWAGKWANSPPNIPGLQFNFIGPNELTRYLGIMIGNPHYPDVMFSLLKDKLNSALSARQMHFMSDIGRTLAANSCLLGKIVYPASYILFNNKCIDKLRAIIHKYVANQTYTIPEATRT